MSTSTSMSPVDAAAAVVAAARASVADATRIAAEASAKRLTLENVVATAKSNEAAARSASNAARDDLKAANRLLLARTALEHAEADLRAAVEEHEAAAVRVCEVTDGLAAAEQVLERSEIEAFLSDGSFEKAAAADAEAIVAATTALRDVIVRHRARLEVDAAAVRRLHQLGGSGETQPRDGSCAAGHLARALIAVDGRLHIHNFHEFRWPLSIPEPTSPLRTPIGATTRLVDLVLGAIAQGERDSAVGAPDRHLQPLSEAAEIWPHCRTVGDVVRATEAHERAKVAAKARADREAHEARLGVGHAREARLRGRAVDANGQPIGGPADAQASAGAGAGARFSVNVEPAPGPRPAVQPVRRPAGGGLADGAIGEGDYVLEGTVDAPGGNGFPTSPLGRVG